MKRAFAQLVCVVLVFGAGFSLPVGAMEKQVPTTREQIQLSYAPLVRKVAPAVVNIYTAKTVQARQTVPLFNDPFFQQFFGKDFGLQLNVPKKRVQNSLGSGVIVAADGRVVTNHHVIEGADEIKVVLADQREFSAKLVGSDEKTDLALLKIEGEVEGLPFLEFRDSDELEVGDLVLAIGNPFGVGQTVTSGIVSAVSRTRTGMSELAAFIQTDAAINPGNSGGALITMDGRLVGVNTAIFSKSGGSLGIGFAIPSNLVQVVIGGLNDGKGLVRPWLGASGQRVGNDIAQSLGLKTPGGVLINEVVLGGPADKAGIKVGDVVRAVDGHNIREAGALKYRIATLGIGGKATLTLWRRDRLIDKQISLIAPPENPPRNLTEMRGNHPFNGATVANMSPALAQELGIDDFSLGVVVLRIKRGAGAHRVGFRPGDKVVSINDKKIAQVGDLKKIMSRDLKRWTVTIDRQGRVMTETFRR